MFSIKYKVDVSMGIKEQKIGVIVYVNVMEVSVVIWVLVFLDVIGEEFERFGIYSISLSFI